MANEIKISENGWRVLNKKTQTSLKPLFASANNDRFRFTVAAAASLEITQGTGIVFLQFGDGWYVTTSYDGDAFKAQKDGRRSGYSCSCSMILRKMRMDLKGSEFILEKTQFELNFKPVFKILKRLDL